MYKLLKDALEEYYQDCRVGYSVAAKSEKTIRNIKVSWDLFSRVNSVEYCQHITEALLRRFFVWGQEERKWAAMTNRTHRKNLSVFIRWAQGKHYMQQNPLLQIPKPRLPQRLPKHHTKKEIEAMYVSIGVLSRSRFEEVRNKAIIGVAALAGLRRGELISLTLDSVNMESKQILVVAETSKSRKERWVPIVQRLESFLSDYLKLRGGVAQENCRSFWVSSVTGKTLTVDGLEHVVDRISADVGFRLKLHSLRHSYGTYTYAGSHDIKAVQENMGHSDLATTMLYVTSMSDDKRHAAEMSLLNH